ncbi:MAG TPA: CBS domain-containing protein [Nitrospiraceae bacterium]|nr:CBS domain-containing protein [Nitrospiraceae bacterium]
MDEHSRETGIPLDIEISDDDIYQAMKDIQGYLDITTTDFKEIYRFAYRHAFRRVALSVTAQDVMTAEVYSAARETPLTRVAEIMAEKGISGLPVLEQNGTVAGVISEKDFLARMSSGKTKSFMGVVAECLQAKGCVAVSIRAQKAEDIMTSPAITVRRETSIMEIANTFTEKHINRVPVTDEAGTVNGIVSRADIIGASFINKKPRA